MKKIHAKNLSVALCLIFSAALLPLTGIADAAIEIATIEELQRISDNLTADYVLVNDIDASSTRTWNVTGGIARGFEPIGSEKSYFTGSFDGRGHIIRNLYINRPDEDRVGLFGYADNATITDVGMDNATITGDYAVGALVGTMYPGAISACFSSGTISGGSAVGGLIGVNWATMTSCHSNCAVSSRNSAGGLVGENAGGRILKCRSSGMVNGGDYTGGLIGYMGKAMGGNAVVDACYSIATVRGANAVGGLLGGANDFGLIRVCYSTGTVTGNFAVGGFVGYNSDNLTDCYSTGAVRGIWYVGGFVGYNEKIIKYPDDDGYDDDSFAGKNREYDYYKKPISRCYSTGMVLGESFAGGFAGYNDDTVSACFWDMLASGTETGIGIGTGDVTGKTTDAMKTRQTFTAAGWDFETVWTIVEGATYPFFHWMPLVTSGNRVVAAADRYATQAGTTLTVAAPGVLDNDTAPENTPLTAMLVAPPVHGDLSLSSDGSFVYTPDLLFTGTDLFIYKAFGGAVESPDTMVVITVEGNRCPAVLLYGEGSPQVKAMRTFRDTVLAKSAAGRAMIDLYYSLVPFADNLLDHPLLRDCARAVSDALLRRYGIQ